MNRPQRTTYLEGYMPGPEFQAHGPQFVPMNRDVRFASAFIRRRMPGLLMLNVPPGKQRPVAMG